MKRLIPDTLAARTLLALIVGLALSHAISIGLYLSDRSVALVSSSGEHVGDRIAMVDRLVGTSPAAVRQELLEMADSPRLHITWTKDSAIAGQKNPDRQTGIFRDALATHLFPDDNRIIRLRYMGMTSTGTLHANEPQSLPATVQEETMMISLSQPDGSWLNFTVPVSKPESLWSVRFGLSMTVMLSAVLILSVLAVYYLTRPLATFAQAARRLGVDVRAPPLPETGPVEIRQAAAAFNEMQGRIRRFVEDRTQMIAAISHDLGTPIARLRLRMEFAEDEDQRKKMLADLDDMEKMVFATLSFARDEADNEPGARVDLRTLLQRICNDATDMGWKVSLDLEDEVVPFNCRPTALRRALGNLVDNAVKYGHQVDVSCSQNENDIKIVIVDDGPGIPADRQEDVFKPFQRLEQSRSRETGGTGLGLTVARTIIRAHGGKIKLYNHPTRGLCVEVTLPR
jgi:signal transduction histidine kinase